MNSNKTTKHSTEQKTTPFGNVLLPAVLFDGDLRHGKMRITENKDFFHLQSDGQWINFKKYKKYTVSKTGLLWGHWGERYRDGLSARFFDGEEKYSFQVLSRTEMLVHKNGR